MAWNVRHAAHNLCARPSNLAEVGNIKNETIFISAEKRGISFGEALSRGASRAGRLGRFYKKEK